MSFVSLLRLNKTLCGLERYSNLLLRQKIYSSNVRLCSSKKGTHQPNAMDKYMLVWMKKYPSVSAVPNTVSNEEMEKTRNWIRIRVNIVFCIVTGFVCVLMVFSGKSAAKRGENLHKKNIQWHKELNAEK